MNAQPTWRYWRPWVQTSPTAANKLSALLAEGCDTLILQRTTNRATNKHLYIAHTGHGGKFHLLQDLAVSANWLFYMPLYPIWKPLTTTWNKTLSYNQTLTKGIMLLIVAVLRLQHSNFTCSNKTFLLIGDDQSFKANNSSNEGCREAVRFIVRLSFAKL